MAGESLRGIRIKDVNLCSCMGPMYGDPYCYCIMQQKGLTPSPFYKPSKEQEKRLDDALAEIFDWKKNGST